MNRPKIFVSSTIYDFQDLRSALKYWVQEYGYETQLSEYNDFQKDLTLNSYDACLKSIENCDYFILLIGGRRGGLYPGEDISITQKEYETAYELAKRGKIKRIIVFIRQSIWDVREDRKALAKVIKNIKEKNSQINIPDSELINHDSTLIHEAESVFSFINLVTRNKESKSNQKPLMNWVHVFNSFSDIIDVLKSEFEIRRSIDSIAIEQSIKHAIIFNLQQLLAKEQGELICFYRGFKEINCILSKERQSYVNQRMKHKEYYVTLSYKNISQMSNFALFYFQGINDIQTFAFEQALSSGVLLEYSKLKDCFVENNFFKALSQMIFEIQRLKQAFKDYSSDDIDNRILNNIKEGLEKSKSMQFKYRDLAFLNSIYMRISNIVTLSAFMTNYINTHDDTLPYPELCNVLSNPEIPTETEIEELLINNI